MQLATVNGDKAAVRSWVLRKPVNLVVSGGVTVALLARELDRREILLRNGNRVARYAETPAKADPVMQHARKPSSLLNVAHGEFIALSTAKALKERVQTHLLRQKPARAGPSGASPAPAIALAKGKA